MYIVKITNGTTTTTIHGANHKLLSGTVVQGINTIDSFQFSVLYNNPAFRNLNDFTTLVSVFNDRKNRYEFQGRVLYSTPSMSEKGLIVREATCESFLGFLCDSTQKYVAEQSWTVRTFLTHVIECHNSQLEEYKHFKVRFDLSIDLEDKTFTCAIEREKTWDTIKKNLLDNIGGEIRFDVHDDGIRLYYSDRFGETKETEIALSKNMKSITQESNPSSFITRLFPLGAKISDDSEERVDITDFTGGRDYIEDKEGIEKYGLHIGSVVFDDATTAEDVFSKGHAWLRNNNKVLVKYSITALDLSLKGLDIDDFQIYNYHPVKNKLLNIDDVVRISKKTIDVCEEVKSSFEIGDTFKALSQIQREQTASLTKINADVAIIKKDYVTNKVLQSELQTATQSIISQSEESILLKVGAGYVANDTFNTYKETTNAKLELTVGKNDNSQIVSMLNASADEINITSDRLSIQSTNFTLSKNGTIIAKAAQISGVFKNTVYNAANYGDSTIKIEGDILEISAPAVGYNETTPNYGSFILKRGGTTTYNGKAVPDFVIESPTAALSIKAPLIIIGNSNSSGSLWGTWTLNSGATITSDRNAKHDIEILPENYEHTFDNLQPVRFKYNDGTSGRYHMGFIAQDVAEAVENAGLSLTDFAAVCAPSKSIQNALWGIRYEEIVALNTQQIQKLKARIKQLEERIAST